MDVFLPRTAESVSRARGVAGDLLGADHHAYEAVRLVVSELVTNAFKHADRGRVGKSIRLALFRRGPIIRIEVTDQGAAFDAPRREVPFTEVQNARAEFGRGLVIVDELSQGNWGSRGHGRGRGRTVWCELPADPFSEIPKVSGLPEGPGATDRPFLGPSTPVAATGRPKSM
ncbi:ATP-binding protein [Streptosporangium sp. NPDC023825]|uniref:ATP-binding protein n=1 Tax=Streptosporangium sp. NPDC023825 TaxID=3154909 RepID=UPI0034250E36